MQLWTEDAVWAKNTSPAAVVQELGFVEAVRSLTAMTIDALDVVAGTAIATTGHARHNLQPLNFLLRRDAIMPVSAVISVRAFLTQEVNITHFELAYAVDLSFIVV